MSGESGRSRPSLSEAQKEDIGKVQKYEVKEAKDLITVESLAEHLLGPEPTREALAAERERSTFVGVMLLLIQKLSNCCDVVCADRPIPSSVVAAEQGEEGGEDEEAEVDPADHAGTEAEPEEMSFSLDFLKKKRAATESSGEAAKRLKAAEPIHLEQEAPLAHVVETAPKEKAPQHEKKKVPEPKKKGVVIGAPKPPTATDQGAAGARTVDTPESSIDQLTVFDNSELCWSRNPHTIHKVDVDRVEHNSVMRLVKDINQDLYKVKYSVVL